MATKTADKFKCPKCGSGRTKPLSVAIAGGTRRRNTVGISRRSMWSSTSTYKSDLVSSLPQRPSNGGAHLCIFLGVCGVLFALFIGSNMKGADGFAVVVGVVSLLLVLGGIRLKKPPDQLANAQANWDPAPSKVSSTRVSGMYLGTVHNQGVDLTSSFSVLLLQKKAGVLEGCAEIKPPLYGSGELHGNIRGSRLNFTVADITFHGDVLKQDITGSYVVSRQDGNQLGDFRLTKQPTAETLHGCAGGVLTGVETVKQSPRSTTVYADVGGNYATLYKRCAFLPTDNYGRCGFGPETIAKLKNGNRVKVLSRLVRGENGDDIYKVRTQQGWEGWIDSKSITIEAQ